MALQINQSWKYGVTNLDFEKIVPKPGLPDFAWFYQNLSRWPHIFMIDIDSQCHWEVMCQILEHSDHNFCAMQEG